MLATRPHDGNEAIIESDALPLNRSLPDGWRWVKLGEACKQNREIVEPNSERAAKLQYFSLGRLPATRGRPTS